ncbi:hypothetical protein P3G55_20715 [Leptospira sp. 96542]|nr:hypothetical protein [Leptospira sp. 96542]
MKRFKQSMRDAAACALRYVLALWSRITPGLHPEHGFVSFFGGSSKSSQTTNNTDNRNAVNGDGGVSGTGNTLTINKTDNGAVSRALDSIDIANANQGKSFESLLSAGLEMFKTATATTQASSSAVASGLASAYSTAQADKAGSLDNRTIIMLAGIAAAVIGFAFWSKKK